ncbi:hypothetical protein [Streptomyces sp. NPDC001404]|uniref:hypothetical protein n=1 Tax=Streptomyces sp. NPDC001404 TaxID=3364571 RepID=UPI00368DB649
MPDLTGEQWTVLIEAAADADRDPVPAMAGDVAWQRILEAVLPLYERMLYPVLRGQRDHAREMVADVLDERNRARSIAVALENENARLRDTAREFRIPMANDYGPIRGEVVVQRLTSDTDRWAVMDGPGPSRRAWHAEQWLRLGEITPALAYKHRLDEAMDLAEQVAEIEGACREAQFLAGQDGDL